MEQAHRVRPDVVVCDYDLLATVSLEVWERDAALGETPLVAVSLTRHPAEVHPVGASGAMGFLYLPTLDGADAWKLLRAAAARPRYRHGAGAHGAGAAGAGVAGAAHV